MPNLPEEIPVIRLVAENSDFKSKDFRVRRLKVLIALQWLVNNNPIYSDVIIDENRINALPEDNVISGLRNIYINEETGHSVPEDRGPVLSENVNEEMSSFLPINLNMKKQKDIIIEQANTYELEFISDTPFNEFSTEYIAAMSFPTLFSDGRGDPTNVFYCKGNC